MDASTKPSLRILENELMQWGQWARATQFTCGLRQYESPAFTLHKIKMEQHREPPRCEVTMLDQQFLSLEQHIQSLKVCRPELFFWIVAYYLFGWPIRHLANKTGISRNAIDQKLIAAENWLDSRIGLYEDIISGKHD